MITVPCDASSRRSAATSQNPSRRRSAAASPRRERARAAVAPATGGCGRRRGVAIDDHRQAAEPVLPGLLEQLEPVPRDRASSTAEARQASAAATARSAPGSTERAESASVSPAAARALAAGGMPSRSASARSSACSRSWAERERSATSSRSEAAARAAAASSLARCSSSSGVRPSRLAIVASLGEVGLERLSRARLRTRVAGRGAPVPRRARRVDRSRPPGPRSRRRGRLHASALRSAGRRPSPRRRRQDAARTPQRESAPDVRAPPPDRALRPRHARHSPPHCAASSSTRTDSSLRSATACSASARSALQPLLEPRRRFAAQRETLARSLQAVQRPERSLTAAGGIGQLVLGLPPLLEQRGEPLLGAAPRDRDGVAARLGVGAPFGDGFEVELRDPGAQRRDLDDELLGALGCRRLQGERTKALLAPPPRRHGLARPGSRPARA